VGAQALRCSHGGTRSRVPPLGGLYAAVEAYYSRKLSRHGATPRGVDWESAEAQALRFAQLMKLCEPARAFSLNDVGCGYGALLGFLAKLHAGAQIDYLGIDLSPAMIRRARAAWRRRHRVSFAVATRGPRVADYSVASGIFNVKLDQPAPLWERFIATTLADMHRTSRKGFAVNFLLPPAPGRTSPPELYRTASKPWIGYCREALGASVEFIGDYGLDEFTLLVRW